jgi:ferredoxin
MNRDARRWHKPCSIPDDVRPRAAPAAKPPNESQLRRASMTYKIIASQCTGCSLCEFECPNAAISMKGDTFVIDPKKCTECEGHFDHAKCDEVCPVPGTCVKA